jgi:hypothetical protein
MMTAVPLGMLVVFIVWMAGGPKQSLAWLETVLRSIVASVGSLVR